MINEEILLDDVLTIGDLHAEREQLDCDVMHWHLQQRPHLLQLVGPLHSNPGLL